MWPETKNVAMDKFVYDPEIAEKLLLDTFPDLTQEQANAIAKLTEQIERSRIQRIINQQNQTL